MRALKLENRAVIAVSGRDAETLLQGLITNDIAQASGGRVVYAALLTPQGKYLFDFFIARRGDSFLLDVEAARKDDLIKRLTFYKLRADAEIEDASGSWRVWAFWDAPEGPTKPGQAKPFEGGVLYRDPRLAEIGFRAFLPTGAKFPQDIAPEEYERRRIELGLPDSSRDIEPDKRFILEANFSELNGVDFKKGCYVGQEMTARMTYRGSLKKRLLPVELAGPLPAPGTPILANGKKAGHILSGVGKRAIALVRLEHADGADLATGEGTRITVRKPPWLVKAGEKD